MSSRKSFIGAHDSEAMRADRELHAIADAEFLKDAVEVSLHGLLGDEELLRDLRVAHAERDQPDDRALAIRERGAVGRGTIDGMGGTEFHWHPDLPARHRLDRLEEALDGKALEHDGPRARAHRRAPVLGMLARRDDDDLDVRCELRNVRERALTHLQVEEQEVAAGFDDERLEVPRPIRLADDDAARLHRQERLETHAEQRVVVGNDDSEWGRGLAARRRPEAVGVVRNPALKRGRHRSRHGTRGYTCGQSMGRGISYPPFEGKAGW